MQPSVHSSPPTRASVPVVSMSPLLHARPRPLGARRVQVRVAAGATGTEGPGAARGMTRGWRVGKGLTRVAAVPLRDFDAHGNRASKLRPHVDQAGGNRRFGDHGLGHRRGGAVHGYEVVLRSRAQARPTAWSPAWRSPWPAGREGQADRGRSGDEISGRVRGDDRPGRARRRRPRHRVGRRGPGGEEAPLRRARPHLPRDTILATNTSTLPVVEMAMETGRPDRVCGIHFFNPAPVMSLVEVVRPITASDATIAAAKAFAEACGKDAGRGEGPGRVHRQRAAVPLPQQRGAPARERRGHEGRHRHRHEGRVRVPDGAVRPARPGRAWTRRWRSSTRSTRSSATPTTRPSRCCAGWWPPSQLGRKSGQGFYDYRK